MLFSRSKQCGVALLAVVAGSCTSAGATPYMGYPCVNGYPGAPGYAYGPAPAGWTPAAGAPVPPSLPEVARPRPTVKVTTTTTYSPYASSPLYRVDQPDQALAGFCDEGCGGSRCDQATGRCIYPCKSNSDCMLGYSCMVVSASGATLCIWP
jgi:hypothetical protein